MAREPACEAGGVEVEQDPMADREGAACCATQRPFLTLETAAANGIVL